MSRQRERTRWRRRKEERERVGSLEVVRAGVRVRVRGVVERWRMKMRMGKEGMGRMYCAYGVTGDEVDEMGVRGVIKDVLHQG